MLRIGIDLGGTKIEGVALDGSAEVGRARVPTPRDDYAATLEAVAGLVERLEQQAGSRGTVGVGIPGAISSQTGLVKNANSTCLIGRPLRQDLDARLAREVRVANDANCFATSEASDGAADGADVVFGVIIGTGTGGGVVVRGEVLVGPNGLAGEWGHNPLPWAGPEELPGPPCYCGRHGCLEPYLSGPGLERDHQRSTGRHLTAIEIAAGAAAGEAASVAAVERYESRLARGLAGVINVLDPDVIVLGGGVSNIDRLYDRVPRLWGAYVFARGAMGGAGEEPVRTRLVRARHGDSSGVRGAAWLWPA